MPIIGPMKILHTADIHLRTIGDSRWQALEYLVRLANDRSVSLFVISGDLFDRQVDVPQLKGPLREVFQRCGARIVVLPGNHDLGAIAAGDYYGEDVTIFSRSDRFLDIGDVRLFGLPFENIEGEKILEKLFWIRGQTRSDATNILLYHGELLEMVYSRDGFGEEDAAGYMPVRLSYFDGLGIDYVLAGHFHTKFEVRQYKHGYFVYPGSPVSTTRKEAGVRKVNLFDTGGQPMPVALDTPHFEDVVVDLDPMSDEHPIETIRKRLRQLDQNARVLLTVSGFVDLVKLGKTEKEFGKDIGALMTPQIEKIDQPWKDVGVVLQSDLFERCEAKLAARDFSEGRKNRVRRMIIEAMMKSHVFESAMEARDAS